MDDIEDIENEEDRKRKKKQKTRKKEKNEAIEEEEEKQKKEKMEESSSGFRTSECANPMAARFCGIRGSWGLKWVEKLKCKDVWRIWKNWKMVGLGRFWMIWT